MKISVKSKSGVEARVQFSFGFKCPECGFENSMVMLSHPDVYTVDLDNEREIRFNCHKCEYVEPFILTLT